jgi:hypothetical protein
VQDDAASYSSFKEHVHQIDLLFPQWLHVAPQGTLMAISNDTHRSYPIVDGNTVHDPDDGDKVKRVIQEAKEDTEIFPHLNNYNAARSPGTRHGRSAQRPGKRRSAPADRALLHRLSGLSRPVAGL